MFDFSNQQNNCSTFLLLEFWNLVKVPFKRMNVKRTPIFHSNLPCRPYLFFFRRENKAAKRSFQHPLDLCLPCPHPTSGLSSIFLIFSVRDFLFLFPFLFFLLLKVTIIEICKDKIQFLSSYLYQ